MKLRVLIADDEELARDRLRELLEAEPAIEIVGECSTGIETVKAIRRESPHLVLLDVRMPEMDGFEVIRALDTDRLPVIIFVTAHDQYALKAFEADAAGYLLKPFDIERFRQSIGRARELVRRGANYRRIEKLPGGADPSEGTASAGGVGRLAIRSAGRILFVRHDEVDWIQSADNYLELHVGKTVHLLRQTLTSLEGQLPARQFLRISRSLMVNVNCIKAIRPKSHGDFIVILRDGKELPASRNYRSGLTRILGKPE